MSRRVFGWTNIQTIEEPAVNLTPLIDVVFVILIMFIVVAPLLELDRVTLPMPPLPLMTNPYRCRKSSPIAIYVRQDNTIMVAGQPVSLIQLAEYLKQAKQRYPTAKPQLFHDKKAHFGVYQAIKNAAEAAGFQQMDIILQPA